MPPAGQVSFDNSLDCLETILDPGSTGVGLLSSPPESPPPHPANKVTRNRPCINISINFFILNLIICIGKHCLHLSNFTIADT